ncbi:hypothetical protein B2G71_02950 [Novosphingobium sp. PC22D]|uniref:protein tyrosine phosphatase family protein n=1 Tax=Novosphingobium sp. PC22D TaxID=1962403 RepID=UPI000BF22C53|nr:protein tyrosine phosphatase family protein [Novosphingobium sp. PC22D]PEQ14550.1 hypothetical protein B2G71_02950 [Novosphingobium sp. PC22D]
MADPQDIFAWQRLDARTTTSGHLTVADLDRLAALGVGHVINLALDSAPRALADEGALLAERGIAYTHIPVPFEAPDETHFAAFREALDAYPDAPLHVHCMMNWRVSAFFYRYHRDVAGMPEPEARALMETQWSPTASDDPRAPAWAAFIERRG